MLSKFYEASRVICTNPVLFGSIILTISLPKNLLINYGYYSYPHLAEWIGFSGEFVFASLYAAAIVYALSRLKEGQRPSYSETMATAFRNWQKLLIVRSVATLLTMVGLVALFIPGIMLFVRYALLEPVVVLEGAGTAEAMTRSEKLTIGLRWQIFFALSIIILPNLLLGGWIYTRGSLLQYVAALFLLGFVQGAFGAILQTVMFLYYWEAVSNERWYRRFWRYRRN